MKTNQNTLEHAGSATGRVAATSEGEDSGPAKIEQKPPFLEVFQKFGDKWTLHQQTGPVCIYFREGVNGRRWEVFRWIPSGKAEIGFGIPLAKWGTYGKTFGPVKNPDAILDREYERAMAFFRDLSTRQDAA